MRAKWLAPVLLVIGFVMMAVPAFASVQRTVMVEEFGFQL